MRKYTHIMKDTTGELWMFRNFDNQCSERDLRDYTVRERSD